MMGLLVIKFLNTVLGSKFPKLQADSPNERKINTPWDKTIQAQA